MKNWYKVAMTTKDVAHGRHKLIQNAFEAIFMKMGGNKEWALLSSGFNPDGSYNIYFTPACNEVVALKTLIDSNQGVASEEPTDNEIALLVGIAGVWDHLIRTPNRYRE